MDDQNPHNEPPEPINRRARRNHRLHDLNRVNRLRHPIVRPRPPRRPYMQKYRYEWQTQGDRQMWLRRAIDSEHRARCKVCQVHFNATLTVIRNHENSNAHVVAMNNYNFVDDDEPQPLNLDDFKREVARIKLILTLFFAQNNLPFKLINTLLPVIKDIAKSFDALRAVKMKRTTMTNILKNVIAPTHKLLLTRQLEGDKFSLLYDDSTDVTKEKHGCASVRFFSKELGKVVSTVWDLIKVYNEDDENSNETAEALYNGIILSLNEYNIPNSNLVGFMSDGCNVMVGGNNSVAQRMRRDFSNIITEVCPCHGAYLCASCAMREMPPEIVDFAKDIYNFFNSSKRLHSLQQHQIDLNLDLHKLLRPVPTRWLSNGAALDRIEEQWVPIINTLRNLQVNETAVRLFNLMSEPTTKCYVAFFNFILPSIENLNGFLQTEEVIIPEVYSRMVEDLEDICLCLIQENHIREVGCVNINFLDANNYLNLYEIRVGNDARNMGE